MPFLTCVGDYSGCRLSLPGAFRPTYWDLYTAAIVVIEVLLALEHLVALRERKVVETWHHRTNDRPEKGKREKGR